MPMSDIILWILGALVALFGGGFLLEQRKAKKAEKAKKEAEAERDKAKLQVKLEQAASQVKDELAVKKAELARESKEVIQSVESIPESKEVELSDEEKQLAADQSARAHARADRLQNTGSANGGGKNPDASGVPASAGPGKSHRKSANQ